LLVLHIPGRKDPLDARPRAPGRRHDIPLRRLGLAQAGAMAGKEAISRQVL
jgi:hypothetical protein